MPAAPQQERLNQKKLPVLGVIAGGGKLPERLLSACDRTGQDVFVVGFDGQTDPGILENRNHMMTRIGAAGKIISTLKNHNVRDLVLIGSIRRPSLAELKPDLRTARFFASVALKALGDDGLLRALRHELEGEGFTIHGVQDFVADLLAPEGPVGRYKPKKQDWPDIERGVEASQMLGQLDVGQSVIVQEGIILGVEAAEGTDELIRRCSAYKRRGRGAILVKSCKPQQDRSFDLPTIGPDTVQACAMAGMAGIVMQARRSLLVDPEKVAALADKYKIFVLGLDMKTGTESEIL